MSADDYRNEATKNLRDALITGTGIVVDALTDNACSAGKVIVDVGKASGNTEMAGRMAVAESAAQRHSTTPEEEFQKLCDAGAGPYDDIP